MRLKNLIEAQPALMRLSSERMPAKLAYAISKNLRLVDQELKDYDKARMALLADYPLNKETNRYDIPSEKLEEFNKVHAELIDMEISDFKPHKIAIETFGNVEVTPGELVVLDWMIGEEIKS
jgi:hypothetical protein